MSAPTSAFAPLRNRAFLLMWTANVLSNTGGWMQTTGAAWEMTTLTPEPIFVALLSASSTLPMFLFGFFAGVLADRFDRRRYIIACQFWMMAVAATLAVLAFFHHLTHWNLVGLCFCMGLGNAMNGPAYGVVPEVVPSHDLRPAIALNSAGFNLARMVGPVLGQVLLGLVGVFLLFTVNTFTFIGVIVAMVSWRRPARRVRHSIERITARGDRAGGISTMRGSGDLQTVLLRGLCFSVPAIAFSTLLPVIGRFELGMDEFWFGVLYAIFFGAGAVAGAAVMSTVNRLLGPDRANIWAMGICGAVTLVCALAMTPWVVGVAAAVNGACWITVSASSSTPRARPSCPISCARRAWRCTRWYSSAASLSARCFGARSPHSSVFRRR